MPKAPTPKEIRDRYSDYAAEWKDTISEGRTDMRFVSGDPWEPADRRARKMSGRPCISLDQINQYLNQTENNIRQTELAIQILPVGDGANDKTATSRENIIRGIDYRSNGQAVDITAFQGAIQRGYGYSRIITQPVDAESFDLELRLKRLPNPDCVLLDPDYKEADASDIQHGFITDLLRKPDFKKKYPKAKPVSFEGQETAQEVSLWVRENYIQVAEFWRAEKTPRTLLLVDVPTQGPTPIYEDELKPYLEKLGERSGRTKSGKFARLRDQVKVLRERQTDHIEVIQYLTNGIEILDEVPWPGTRIPILSCFGKELYVDDGGGAKRILMSMVRLARDPQMLAAYLATLECEEAGMVPKSPFVGYKGQFESDQEAWEYLSKIPKSFIQVDPIVDGVSGTVLPLPTRPQFIPNFQAYEIAKDSAGRSLQSAMGISPLPTPAQRQSEKSGVALERIETSEAIGSFHFTDNYKRYLHNKGWQLNELIEIVYDTTRDVPVGLANGKNSTMRINDFRYGPQAFKDGSQNTAYDVQNADKEHYHTGDGDHDVTVSTGPSYQSQREQQSSFVDLVIQNIGAWEIPQEMALKIIALGVRMKDLGATGNEIAELLDPPDPNNLSPQAQAQIQGLQAQLQGLQTQLAAVLQDRARRELEAQTKVQIKQMEIQASGAADAAGHVNDQELAKLQVWAKIVVAELAKQSKQTDLAAQQDASRIEQALGHAHEVGTQAAEHAHEHSIADKNAQIASAQQASQAAADAGSQASAQTHEENMTTQGQSHEQQMAEQNRENQPEEE